MTSHERSSFTRVQFAMLRVSLGRTYGSSAMYLQSDQRHTEREPRGWYVVCGGRLVRRGAILNGVRVLGASSGY